MNRRDIINVFENEKQKATDFSDVFSDVEDWTEGKVSNLGLYWSLARNNAKRTLSFLIDYVIQEGKFEKAFSFTIFINTLRKGYFDAIEVLIDKGYDLNKKDPFEFSIVSYFQTFKEAEFFERFEAKMNPTLLDEYKGKMFELLVE